ncbi:MAG: hypothetical protein MUC56_17260 [Thermoanaerobaculales bacterium]|jgi:hypothetical protein|nr:hypothetical protein [Thermoanaerobaculales bacterium]
MGSSRTPGAERDEPCPPITEIAELMFRAVLLGRFLLGVGIVAPGIPVLGPPVMIAIPILEERRREPA